MEPVQRIPDLGNPDIFSLRPYHPEIREMLMLDLTAKITMSAGEEKTILIQLTSRDFAFFDVEQSLWQVASGEFTLSAGFSAKNLQAFTTVTRKAEEIAK